MVFDEDAVTRLRKDYPSVGFPFLLEMIPFWVRDERYWLNRKKWKEEGAIPGKLVDIGIPPTVDHILTNEELWRVYQDKVPQELLHDLAFRLEMIHAGLFYGVPGVEETPFLGRGLRRGNALAVEDDVHNYWAQWDAKAYGENRVPPGYVDAKMVDGYCNKHRIMPLEPKILWHLGLR